MLYSAALVLLGLVLLTAGAEALVRGAVRLAAAAGLSPLVIGLTVVAFGTSAPELAVGLKSAWQGASDIALGNAVGSNTFNVLMILGLAALIAPLAASRQLIRLDVPVMIAASLAVWVLAADGRVSPGEGVGLLIGLGLYTAWLVGLGLRQPAVESVAGSGVAEGGGAGGLWAAAAALAVGLVLLLLGSRWLVDGAVTLAQAWGVSDRVIGLTVVAAGTSTPELATSLMASLRGQRDIAIGNVVGSNTFNLLGVLGASAFVAGGLPVTDQSLGFDLPVMVAVAVVCLPIFFTGGRINRWEGGVLLGYYALYTGYLVLSTTTPAAVPGLTRAMLGFVIPLTLLGLLVSLAAVGRRRPAATGTS